MDIRIRSYYMKILKKCFPGCVLIVSLGVGGMLTPILEAIHVYWHSLSCIPLGILDKIKIKCFNFPWEGKREKDAIHLIKWEKLAKHKALGGCDLENIHQFGKALAKKSLWILIKLYDF